MTVIMTSLPRLCQARLREGLTAYPWLTTLWLGVDQSEYGRSDWVKKWFVASVAKLGMAHRQSR